MEQYDEFEIPGMPEGTRVNGSKTINDNVADAGGLHAAYAAWRRKEREEPGMGLQRLEYFTKEQMFFVAWGRGFCESGTGEEIFRRMELTAHAPERVRLLGTVENSEEFKEAFGCPNKAPRCKLW